MKTTKTIQGPEIRKPHQTPHRTLDLLEIERENHSAARSQLVGPSQFEIEYFRQLREEITIFLHSKGFTTIREVHIDLFGPNFRGHLQVSA